MDVNVPTNHNPFRKKKLKISGPRFDMSEVVLIKTSALATVPNTLNTILHELEMGADIKNDVLGVA